MIKSLPMLDTPVPGRVCWECDHINFRPAEGDYSEYTPGSDFTLNCGKLYWDFNSYGDSLDDFREKLQSAEQCADFKER